MKLQELLLENTKNNILTQIAKKHLGIKTLRTQNNDNSDFHDLAVWKIKAALNAAYKAGQQDLTSKVDDEVEAEVDTLKTKRI